MRCAGRDHAGALCDDHIPVRSTPEAAPSPTAPRTRWPDPASCSGGGRSLPAVHPASARRRGRECLAVTAIAPGPGVRFCQPDLIGSGGPSVPCRPPGARLTAHPPPHIVAPERGLKTRCARTSPPPRPPSRLTIGGLRTPPARRISGATVPVPTCSRAGCPSDGRLLLATTRLSPSAARGCYPAKARLPSRLMGPEVERPHRSPFCAGVQRPWVRSRPSASVSAPSVPIGAAAREHAEDDDQPRVRVEREQHTPLADAQSGFRPASQLA